MSVIRRSCPRVCLLATDRYTFLRLLVIFFSTRLNDNVVEWREQGPALQRPCLSPQPLANLRHSRHLLQCLVIPHLRVFVETKEAGIPIRISASCYPRRLQPRGALRTMLWRPCQPYSSKTSSVVNSIHRRFTRFQRVMVSPFRSPALSMYREPLGDGYPAIIRVLT